MRRLLERPDSPSAPEGECFDAAALFADISGFTALAARLARTGPSGVEALSELLNGCFGELVELVAAHRGDVVKFAGDALLAFWPADADLAAATARAASCGLALQGFLDATELAADERLTMRVGIGAGQGVRRPPGRRTWPLGSGPAQEGRSASVRGVLRGLVRLGCLPAALSEDAGASGWGFGRGRRDTARPG